MLQLYVGVFSAQKSVFLPIHLSDLKFRLTEFELLGDLEPIQFYIPVEN